MKIIKKVIPFLIVISCAQLCANTIYKTVDANGHTTFSQTASINAVPIVVNNTSTPSQNKLIKQKNTTLNKKFNTQVQLQKKLNKASIQYDHAKDNYETASRKALKAKENLTNLDVKTRKITLNKDKFKIKEDKTSKNKIKSLTRKVAAAEEKKQRAQKKLEQAEEAVNNVKTEFHH